MASFKSHPVFFSTLIVLGALAAGEAWLVFGQRAALAEQEKKIAQAQDNLQRLARQSPFPSREHADAVQADRVKAEEVRARVRAELTGRNAALVASLQATPPAASTDAYFDLQRFLVDIRAKAQAAQVKIADANQLGFATYASTGPEPALIPAVYRQRQVAQYLVETLLAAGPDELVSLQRERPLTEEQQKQLAEAAASGQPAPAFSGGGEGGDFFAIDPRISARVPGFVEAKAFRLTFTGYSTALRKLLNQLAQFELPLVVRSVEVEPATKTEGGNSRPAAAPAASSPFGVFGGSATPGVTDAEAAKPLVSNVLSRFVVTVELVSLVETVAPANP